MSRSKILSFVVVAVLAHVERVEAQVPHPDFCTYSVTHNGPTWNADTMTVPYTVIANALARDGVYMGGGYSQGMGLRMGGSGVAVASVVYWYKVTHVALPSCKPVEFSTEADLDAAVSTLIHGDDDDYALVAGFQAVQGVALQPASLAVAATNAGAPVSSSTLAIDFGAVSFSMTIPGVSVTTDVRDRDRNSVRSSGTIKTEYEEVVFRSWTKTKVVSNGPFGGFATAAVDSTSVSSKAESTCPIHQVQGFFEHITSEG